MNARRAENLSNVRMTFRSLLCVKRPDRSAGSHAKAKPKIFQPSEIQDSTQTSGKAYSVSTNPSIILELALGTGLRNT